MNTQTPVRQRLGQPDAMEHIAGKVMRAHGGINRTQLAKGLCDTFTLRDAQGRRQTDSCLRALHSMEAERLIRLPARGSPGTSRHTERLWAEVPKAEGVPARVDQMAGLCLALVETEDHLRVWNELMIREHPLGPGWRIGRTVRYLVQSEHGVLGAVGFGPSAFSLADRESWIGWNGEQKHTHLNRVIGMTRFLIRPAVDCRNLASCVLSLAVKRVGADFEKVYHYRPWLLETFVDTSRYEGTCYQAANWVRVGETCGRGRQDRARCAEKTVKAIYVYALEADFRRRMGLARDAGDVAIPLQDDAAAADWAEKEFGGADLGDRRLSRRLVKIAAAKGARPGKSCAKTVDGDWADTMGFYRFVEHVNADALTMDSILAPHRQRTLRRMRACKTVLCIQDTTDLDYAENRACEGLGVIGTNQTGTESRGLRLHSTLATDGDGLPLGILRAHCYAPEQKPERRGKDARYIPIEKKDTYRWIEAQNDIAEAAAELPGVRVVSIADREGDFFEHFHSWDRDSNVDLLIRAEHDRSTDGPLKLFAAIGQTPVRGNLQIQVSRRSGRPKKGTCPPRPARSPRDAEVEIRFMPVAIRPPRHGLSRAKPPVDVYLIHVHEPPPPAHTQDPIDWYLLTTLTVDSMEAAEQCVKWYCRRWRIEDWHRVLKSGCRVEDIRLQTAERLKRAIAIDMVLAWRIMLMTLLGRDVPELPAQILFTEMEVDTLCRFAKKKASRNLKTLEKSSA